MIDLTRLNPPQRAAVECTEGPLLVLAGAGSGKTRVLTYRVAHLMEKGVPAWKILAITFTNKAAREMAERVKQLTGEAGDEAWISTFHACCARILRRDIEKLGYKRQFAIYDDRRQHDGHQGHPEVAQSERQGVSAARRSRGHLGCEEPDALAEGVARRRRERRAQPPLLRGLRAIRKDAARQQRAGLRRPAHPDAGTALPDIRRCSSITSGGFEYILVDEYQDTNAAQYELVRLLAGEKHNLCVVGDDDQSIYGWRGADIRNILDFEKDFPEAKVVKLEQNYRSTGNILDAANQVIAHNRGRKEKALWTEAGEGERIALYHALDERDEAAFVAAMARKLIAHGDRPGEIAVLYRTNAQSRVLEEAFVRGGVPYRVYGGQKFYERKEVKDLIAYMRALVNPDDDVSAPPRHQRAQARHRRRDGGRSWPHYAAENELPLMSRGAGRGRRGAVRARAQAGRRVWRADGRPDGRAVRAEAASEFLRDADRQNRLRRARSRPVKTTENEPRAREHQGTAGRGRPNSNG